ncbi:LacI family transcriptional regulator [Chromatiales bacterium (ex Bugula neritina AB1)]|nr:LacI family transcriptional regulator [Chromatiales bacterium (ex Bugula neritina AB1)]
MATGAKPTVNDIARHAGVSLATVDRVLNARPGVRTVTIDRVNKAINELGYIRDTAAANLARRRVYRFVFLMPGTRSEFFDELQAQIDAQSFALVNERTHLRTQRVARFDSREISVALDSLQSDTTDGVAVIAPETPTVRDAVARTRERGIAVVALLTDLPSSPRDHFIGIDNTSAGATAAKLMGSLTHAESGRILVLTGSRLSRDHLERRHGFDKVMAEQFPHLSVLPSIESRDDNELAEKLLPEVFSMRSDIRGIYSSAAGNNGLIQFLGSSSAKLITIAHELTPLSRSALQRGIFAALISQDAGHIVRSAVRLMRSTVDAVPFNAMQERIRIEIFLKENLPPC